MLLLMMEVKGRFNSKLLKRAKFADKYFDSLGNFVEAAEKDLGLGKEVVVNRVNLGNRGTRDLRSRVMGSSVGLREEEAKLVGSLVDLLEKCLVLDPGRRITPKEALNHAFIRG
jgi:serine/threonine-protein kinase PRP4